MKTIRILTVLTAFLLIFGLAACGTGKDNGKSNGNKKAEIASLMARNRVRRTKQPSFIKN